MTSKETEATIRLNTRLEIGTFIPLIERPYLNNSTDGQRFHCHLAADHQCVWIEHSLQRLLAGIEALEENIQNAHYS